MGTLAKGTGAKPSPLRRLSELVKSQGLSGAWSHGCTVALHKAHAALERRQRGAAGETDSTAEKTELDDVTITSRNRTSGVHYLPTPWRVLDWVHEVLPAPDPSWSFVDFGCGKGRVLLSAGRRRYGKVLGVEFAAELAAEANKAVGGATDLAAGAVEVVEADATEVALPETPMVAFLFNPFGPPVIGKVASRLARSYRRNPRPMVVAYLNPKHANEFAAREEFVEVALPRLAAARFATLSPYRLRLFATPEAWALLSGKA